MYVHSATKDTVNFEDLVDDFVTFYVAGMSINYFKFVLNWNDYILGQETTGNLLSFAMILIHQNPDVLCR